MTSSASDSAKVAIGTVDQAAHSFFFKLPLEVRREIYSHIFTKAILHVEAVQPYRTQDNGVMVLSEPEHLSNDQKEMLDHRERSRQPKPDELHPLPIKPVGQLLGLGTGVLSSGLFTMYRCASNKCFESASACPPGYGDHVDCGKIRTAAAQTFPRTCRLAYSETSDHVCAFKLNSALHFALLGDLEAFSMLLNDDQRESICDIRLNLDFNFELPMARWREWNYFCNVFATPWDRRSIQYHFEGSDYPNYKSEISFYYNFSQSAKHDPTKGLASWVLPNIHLGWEGHNSSWGTATDLSELRPRAPLSMRFAFPQFLTRTRDGQIDYLSENVWDDATQSSLRPGDEAHIRFAERATTETMQIAHVLAVRQKNLASIDAEERAGFQDLYEQGLRHYFREPHFDQPNSCWGWLRPLRQCQHFESFDVDFYDEDGPRTSLRLEVARDALRERFTGLGIGPHPFILYTH